jgi:hypothetical protein
MMGRAPRPGIRATAAQADRRERRGTKNTLPRRIELMMLRSGEKQLTLRVFDRAVRISCRSALEFDLLVDVYGALRCPDFATVALEYTVGRDEANGSFSILRHGSTSLIARDDGEFIFLLEKDLTIELQYQRPDLYFLHAAALELDGRIVILAAPSGSGKSTTTWGLLHHGFRYLSDELAPIDLGANSVCAYPHALCLKREPPRGYPLPAAVRATRRTLHVPTASLPAETIVGSAGPLTTIVFLEYRPTEGKPAGMIPISKAEAAARLFALALNPLAHAEDGIAAAAAIAGGAECYRLRTVELGTTCTLLTSALASLTARELAGGAAPAQAPLSA